jgi:hypothetical protein
MLHLFDLSGGNINSCCITSKKIENENSALFGESHWAQNCAKTRLMAQRREWWIGPTSSDFLHDLRDRAPVTLPSGLKRPGQFILATTRPVFESGNLGTGWEYPGAEIGIGLEDAGDKNGVLLTKGRGPKETVNRICAIAISGNSKSSCTKRGHAAFAP